MIDDRKQELLFFLALGFMIADKVGGGGTSAEFCFGTAKNFLETAEKNGVQFNFTRRTA